MPTYKPMPDHEYHAKSDAMLRYIIKDAGTAAEAMRGVNVDAECKYLDQMNDACTILHYRRQLARANYWRIKRSSSQRGGVDHREHNASVLASIHAANPKGEL